MVATTTFPSTPPDVTSKHRVEYKHLRADFGDGYLQIAGDGINPKREFWDLSFSKYPDADIDAIVAFLDARAGTDPFFWTPTLETPESPVKQWIMTSDGYKREHPAYGVSNLTVTFERVYAL